MGDCKDNMSGKTSKAQKLLEKVKTKMQAKKDDVEEKAQTFADMISEADDKLTALIGSKNAELSTERGREEYNQKALSRLKTMSWHLDQILALMVEYINDK